jgi:hypothetical protein
MISIANKGITLLKELAFSRSYWVQVLSRLFVKVFSTYSSGTHNPTIVSPTFGLEHHHF